MQTRLADFIKDTPAGQEANHILRTCVHCGFCTATCPTYQLLGDELDGPRGRIYLIKRMLEGETVTRRTQGHLDRCLTCLSCETTCPSGVRYGRLVDIGRTLIEAKVKRPLFDRALRRMLRTVLPYPARFAPLIGLGRALRPLLPLALRGQIPMRVAIAPAPTRQHARRMLILEGCVQPALAPDINASTARVLDRLGISLIRARGGCCGAVSQHLGAAKESRRFMRRNIDAWWPHIEAGAQALVITASGCGAMIREYGHLLRDDKDYAEKAARISALARDISEVLRDEDLSVLHDAATAQRRIAFHAPCTLQHALQLSGVVESILTQAGFMLSAVPDAHLCCGSAGTYSLLQPALSTRLLDNKLDALGTDAPDLIATANIGCLTHLQSRSKLPVVHWISLLDQCTTRQR